jgi:protease PrsW
VYQPAPVYQQAPVYQPYQPPYQPACAPQPVRIAAPQQWMAPPAQQVPWAAKPKRRIVLEVLVVVLGGLLASAFVALTAYITSGSAIGWAVGLALVPLLTVGAVLLWVDRWEPEPRLLLVAGLLWGGGVAVAVASFLNSVVGPAVGSAVDPGLDPSNASAVYGAPIVEEAMKGLGILLIFLVRRRQFNGPVDGVVYAGVVALGFAVVEDIQYFALNSGESLGFVFVMRALLSPFGHLIFSLPMGLALGIAGRRASRYAWVWMFPIGYLVSVALHMAWNGSLMLASSVGDLAAIFVLLNWVPLALLTLLVVWLRRRESALIASRLRDYVPGGWLTEPEVQTLSSMRASRAARRWASALGAAARASMHAYQRAAVRLAYARQDLYTGHAGIRARQDEMALLEEMGRARADVMARLAAQSQGYAVRGHA